MAIRAQKTDKYYRIYQSTTGETVDVWAPTVFYDDFLGEQLNDYTAADASNGKWLAKITGAAPPTVTVVADSALTGAGGWARCALTADDQKQEAGLYFGDQRCFNLGREPVFEAYINPSTLPAQESEMWIGMGGDYIEGTIVTDGPAEHAFFVLDGSGAIVIYTDDTVNDNNGVATGVTLVNTDWACLRIDFADPSSVKFYINGNRVAATTTFDLEAVHGTATLALQPFLWCHKESTGAETSGGTLNVDYVRIWQDRS